MLDPSTLRAAMYDTKHKHKCSICVKDYDCPGKCVLESKYCAECRKEWDKK